jgi:hypothetical protein
VSHRPVSGQLNQVSTRFGVKEAGADHAMTRIAVEPIRKGRVRVLKESGYSRKRRGAWTFFGRLWVAGSSVFDFINVRVAVCLVAIASCCTPAATSAQEVWLGMRGLAIDWQGVHGHDGWERLFLDPNSAWPPSLAVVRVVQVNTQTLRALPLGDLKKVVARLIRRRMSLAVEMLAQEGDPGCGENVEGYADRRSTREIAEKIKAAGGELAYAAMDEPLWFGHYYNGKGACKSSVPDVARRVSANVVEYTRVFPAIQVGDIEPLPALTAQHFWRETFEQWRKEFAMATGRPLAFLHVDIDWDNALWRKDLPLIAAMAARSDCPLGIIYNATLHVSNSREWLESADQNAMEIEARIGIRPLHAIFESWVRFPTLAIGDKSEPGHDWLVERYGRRRDGGR